MGGAAQRGGEGGGEGGGGRRKRAKQRNAMKPRPAPGICPKRAQPSIKQRPVPEMLKIRARDGKCLTQTRSGVVAAIISAVLGDVVVRKGGLSGSIGRSTGDLLILSVFLTLKPSLERLGVIGLEFDLD